MKLVRKSPYSRNLWKAKASALNRQSDLKVYTTNYVWEWWTLTLSDLQQHIKKIWFRPLNAIIESTRFIILLSPSVGLLTPLV